jgi:hypothetical protein
MYYAAVRKSAEKDALFLELVNHPTNPMTNDDLQRLISKHPDRYGKYACYPGCPA